MCKHIKHVLGIWIIGACLATTVHAGTVTGQLTDPESGGYLQGAVVSLGDGYKAVADRSGTYRINNVSAGSYTMRITYLGYRTIIESITVPATGEVVRNFDMDVPGYL